MLNRDDARSLAMRLPGRMVQTFGADPPATERDWGLVQRSGSDASWLSRGGAILLAADELALVGKHNALNALAALALTSTVGAIDAAVLTALAAFQGLPHRMERVADIGGILFVNDSKGTTVAATLAALEGIGRPSVLIAGGDGKGQDFLPLRSSVESRCRAVMLLGRDAPTIAAALSGVTPAIEFAPGGPLDITFVARGGQLRIEGRTAVGTATEVLMEDLTAQILKAVVDEYDHRQRSGRPRSAAASGGTGLEADAAYPPGGDALARGPRGHAHHAQLRRHPRLG